MKSLVEELVLEKPKELLELSEEEQDFVMERVAEMMNQMQIQINEPPEVVSQMVLQMIRVLSVIVSGKDVEERVREIQKDPILTSKGFATINFQRVDIPHQQPNVWGGTMEGGPNMLEMLDILKGMEERRQRTIDSLHDIADNAPDNVKGEIQNLMDRLVKMVRGEEHYATFTRPSDEAIEYLRTCSSFFQDDEPGKTMNHVIGNNTIH